MPAAAAPNRHLSDVGHGGVPLPAWETSSGTMRTDLVNIVHQWYHLVRKGHDVVCIEPPGRLCALYQNDQYGLDPEFLS